MIVIDDISDFSNQISSYKKSQKALKISQEELKQANQELKVSQKEMERKSDEIALASKNKSDFLANMSHELRTPLNSILILTKLLMDNKDGNMSSKQIDYLQTVLSSGADLMALINDLLDLAKIEAGKMDTEFTDVSLGQIGNKLFEAFTPIAQEKGLEFSITFEDKISDTIHTDLQKFHQILKNLCSNAFKFTSEGGINIHFHRPMADSEVSIKGFTAGNIVAVSVRDSGIGIPDSKLSQIFQAFHQADGSTSRMYGGTGLGLSISNEFAKLLKGEIGVHSEQGRGSTFSLYLPERLDDLTDRVFLSEYDPRVDKSPQKEIQHEPAAQERLTGRSSGHEEVRGDEVDDRYRIFKDDRVAMLFSSDPDLLSPIRGALWKNGFKVLVSDDLMEGMYLLNYFRPGVVVIDSRLKKTDPKGLIHRIENDSLIKALPVIVLSDPHKGYDYSGIGAVESFPRAEGCKVLEPFISRLYQILSDHIKTDRVPEELYDEFYSSVLNDRKVLIVDDDMRNLFSIMSVLDRYGCQIFTGKTGHEGLERLDQEPDIDIVLMDIMMPEMDGYQAMEEIRAQDRFKDLPVIALTARAIRGDRSKCIRSGASDYISKPVEMKSLLAMIKVWLTCK